MTIFHFMRRVRQREFNSFGHREGFANMKSIVLDKAKGSPTLIQLFWTPRRVRQQEYNCFGHSGGSAGVNSIVLDQGGGEMNLIKRS